MYRTLRSCFGRGYLCAVVRQNGGSVAQKDVKVKHKREYKTAGHSDAGSRAPYRELLVFPQPEENPMCTVHGPRCLDLFMPDY
jgi:hypothetical protein